MAALKYKLAITSLLITREGSLVSMTTCGLHIRDAAMLRPAPN
jgi:hypothetical protein